MPQEGAPVHADKVK